MAKKKTIRSIPQERTPMREQEPAIRAKNFKEVAMGYFPDEALRESERCLMCPDQPCVSGCPVGINIPGFIEKIGKKDIRGAYDILTQTSLLPAICGRVCPQENQCEGVCTVGDSLEAVAIGRLERFVGDTAIREGWANIPFIEKNNFKVGIVGSGPAGMACAADMAKAGCDVTVFEAFHQAGGVLKYGIPDFRLPNEVIDAEINNLKKLGVKFECNTLANLTVAENMYIGRGRYAVVRWKRMNAQTTHLLSSLGIPARPTQQLSSCSLAVQQMIAIARAIDMECKILILDEPTSSLDEGEVRKLFELMRELKSRGVGIIFITHFLDQVYEISDRITVLRNGELIGEYEASSLPQFELVSKMMGKALGDVAKIRKHEPLAPDSSVPVFEGRALTSDAGVRPFNFTIQKGEVNGFAGLLGSGRSESARAIFAADKVTGGEVRMNGKRVRISAPLHAMKQGIGYLPEDRKGDGIIAELSVRDNIILALQVMKGFLRPLSRKQAEAFSDQYLLSLNIKTPSTSTPIKSLSGGNQQKVILARWLLTHPEYLILDEPTRGIDVGTKVEIQKLVLNLAEDGVSVTFISSEIEEMLRTCSRLIVMKDREIVGELSGTNVTQGDVMDVIARGRV